jgi:CheY-like chemotaxis protein
VVIVTGYGTEANEAQARAAGVSEFLHKPLSPESIEGSAHFAYSAVALPALVAAPAAPAASVGRFLKNVGLFFAAPFIGLAYILFLPFFGVALAGWAVYQAIKRR